MNPNHYGARLTDTGWECMIEKSADTPGYERLQTALAQISRGRVLHVAIHRSNYGGVRLG